MSRLGLSRGLILSVLLHSLPLLTLIGWRPTVVEIPTPIPVQLIVEQPPAPPSQPKPPDSPLPLRAASADLAQEAAAKPTEATAASASPPAEATAPGETQTASPPEPPEPLPPEGEASSQRAPTDSKTLAMALPPRASRPPKHREAPQTPVPMGSVWPLPLRQNQPHERPRFASLTGPDAVRDEYCVRALNLTLRHLDLLPLSYLGGRRGKTVVTIRILGDGTINSVRLEQSSGYTDIDQRVQRMVFAVGQYPPLPPRMPGTSMDFTFVMVFPDPSQR